MVFAISSSAFIASFITHSPTTFKFSANPDNPTQGSDNKAQPDKYRSCFAHIRLCRRDSKNHKAQSSQPENIHRSPSSSGLGKDLPQA
jgi:hypothetical protein